MSGAFAADAHRLLAIHDPHGVNMLFAAGQCVDNATEQDDAGIVIRVIMDERREHAGGGGQVPGIERLQRRFVTLSHVTPLAVRPRPQLVEPDCFRETKWLHDRQSPMIEAVPNRLGRRFRNQRLHAQLFRDPLHTTRQIDRVAERAVLKLDL